MTGSHQALDWLESVRRVQGSLLPELLALVGSQPLSSLPDEESQQVVKRHVKKHDPNSSLPLATEVCRSASLHKATMPWHVPCALSQCCARWETQLQTQSPLLLCLKKRHARTMHVSSACHTYSISMYRRLGASQPAHDYLNDFLLGKGCPVIRLLELSQYSIMRFSQCLQLCCCCPPGCFSLAHMACNFHSSTA